MSGYNTKVYEEQGGDRLVVASGGSIVVQSGGSIVVESGGTGIPVAGQQAHIAHTAAPTNTAPYTVRTDTVAHAAADAQAAVNAIAADLATAVAKIDALVDVIQTAGLTAAS